MKLLHNKHGRLEKTFFYRYYKYVLWISLTLYFSSSYLIGHHHRQYHPKPDTTTHVSRALSQSTPTNATTPSLKNLKVFVYDLPPKYNTDWLANERCSTHLFASEVAIHRALLTSEVRTFDPYDADFFFVPVYVSCNFSTINGFPAIGHARSLISSAVKLISNDYPFWNRSRGSDHVFVASHDFGSCFHTLEDVAMEDGVPEIMKNSIVLQTFGVKYDHPCQRVEHVVIPPYISPESVRRNFPANGRRDIWVFFRGKMEVHPKNVSGRFYSKKVRTMIWRRFNGDRRFYLRRHRFAGYQSEIARSVFCLCPLGWAPWSPRLVESVALGCVPVIIADGIRLPFPSAVRWADISVTVAEHDVGKLSEILEHVAATNLSSIQRNLWDPRTRRALLFNSEVQEGDATWQVLRGLSEKVDRSYRSSRVSRQLDVDT
ncbi:probable glucuronoxylan glucuronosyltransferase IRX7 [Lotus japonicus]|uniref:probable glucuronoxylan glucuronosyltransferase IRX7 n=1 Tax=Lotus japonicus TaxID=34305 RepID=UPI00258A60DA|nr:probable glucuronoxylan glucuronosyltransferase IRX7 [Lotus japonicus]